VPAELLDVVAAIVRDRAVSPVARISTTRQVQLLHGAGDAVVAEFCDDQVAAGQGADGSIAQLRWREWELELVGDETDAELMDRVSERLLDAGAQPAGVGSKLARVLGTSPRGLPTEPLHRAMAELIGELLVWDRAVRAETDDAVHQMRVTARKIRSLLQASPDSFGLTADAPIIDELRELGNVLGVARDAEVLADRYRGALDEVPPGFDRGREGERGAVALNPAAVLRMEDDAEPLEPAAQLRAATAIEAAIAAADDAARHGLELSQRAHAAAADPGVMEAAGPERIGEGRPIAPDHDQRVSLFDAVEQPRHVGVRPSGNGTECGHE